MPNPSVLDPRAVSLPPRELHTAQILDSATEHHQHVRCTVPSENAPLATDPMPWMPYTVAGTGTWFPKKGNRALIAKPSNGPPWIVAFEPAADAAPDVPLS